MRYTLTLILVVLGTLNVLVSQQLDSNKVYRIGDTLHRAEDRLPSNPRLVHANRQDYWDFTGLMAPYVQEIYVTPPSPVQRTTVVPSDLMFENGDGVEYDVIIDQQDMWITGMRIPHGDNFVYGECENYLPLRLKTDVLGAVNELSGTVIFHLPTEVVAAIKDTELSLSDSIRITVNWNYHLSNDQKGQLQMESGLYDVVRQKLKKAINIETEIKHGGKWMVTERPLTLELPNELQAGTSFSFWSEELADPLAVVQTDDSENAVIVLFSVLRRSGRRVIHSSPRQPDIYVHPNPSFGEVRFDLVNLPYGMYELEIYNILGVKLRSYSLEVDHSMSYPLNLTDLKRGTYIYRLVDAYQKTLRSKRLVIITP